MLQPPRVPRVILRVIALVIGCSLLANIARAQDSPEPAEPTKIDAPDNNDDGKPVNDNPVTAIPDVAIPEADKPDVHLIDGLSPESDAGQLIAIEKRRKASAGFAAIGGIAILGISIITMTMIWARRLRRIARDPLPAQRTAGNDFWFLKPPKPTVDESLPGGDRPPSSPSSESPPE